MSYHLSTQRAVPGLLLLSNTLPLFCCRIRSNQRLTTMKMQLCVLACACAMAVRLTEAFVPAFGARAGLISSNSRRGSTSPVAASRCVCRVCFVCMAWETFRGRFFLWKQQASKPRELEINCYDHHTSYLLV